MISSHFNIGKCLDSGIVLMTQNSGNSAKVLVLGCRGVSSDPDVAALYCVPLYNGFTIPGFGFVDCRKMVVRDLAVTCKLYTAKIRFLQAPFSYSQIPALHSS